jgi:hypothetical protein
MNNAVSSPVGRVVCLFPEVLSEARRKLRQRGRIGHRGKILGMTSVARVTGIDIRALYRLMADDLKEYDGPVLARLCLFFGGIPIERLLIYISPSRPRLISEMELHPSAEVLPDDAGRLDCLLKERMEAWEQAHQQRLTAREWAEMLTRHAERVWGIQVKMAPSNVLLWAENRVHSYNRLFLTLWCAFFDVGIEKLLRYTPAALSGTDLVETASPTEPV